jgi:hypothetical protein
MNDHGAMNKLIAPFLDNGDIDLLFLHDSTAYELESMMKSQQSKRSRLKGKPMTQENYMNCMIAAVSEHILHSVSNKPKKTQGRAAGNLIPTEDDCIKYTEDQDALRARIRNIQSMKSMMKIQDGFNEELPRWKELLEAEEILKGLRVAPTAKDKTKEALWIIFREKDHTTMNKAQLIEMLDEIRKLVKPFDTSSAEESGPQN